MTTIYSPNAVNADHLKKVTAQMETMGAPVIRVVDCGDYYTALEGSHRIQAAFDLGLDPVWVVAEQDDKIDVTGYDWYSPGDWEDTIQPAWVVAEWMQNTHNPVHMF